MAVTKYLNRILAATDADLGGDERLRTSGQAVLHDHTYGITSDALTQFACVFSALIHGKCIFSIQADSVQGNLLRF